MSRRELVHADVLPCAGGPLRGDHEVIDDDGEVHRTERLVSAMCRCGHAASAPWCDGTHKVARQRSAAAPPGSGVRSLSFDGLDIAYDNRVLEPRTWTAAQSRWASELLRQVPAGPVLEVCSGAGHIGLLAVRDHDRELVMVDADPVACDYARRNAEVAGMAHRVTVRHGLLQQAVGPDERFPLIIADPPWVASRDVATYPDDPPTAIDGGPLGLDLVVACVELVAGHLADGGAAVLQTGPAPQPDAVVQHLVSRPELHLRSSQRRLHARGSLMLLVPD